MSPKLHIPDPEDLIQEEQPEAAPEEVKQVKMLSARQRLAWIAFNRSGNPVTAAREAGYSIRTSSQAGVIFQRIDKRLNGAITRKLEQHGVTRSLVWSRIRGALDATKTDVRILRSYAKDGRGCIDEKVKETEIGPDWQVRVRMLAVLHKIRPDIFERRAAAGTGDPQDARKITSLPDARKQLAEKERQQREAQAANDDTHVTT